MNENNRCWCTCFKHDNLSSLSTITTFICLSAYITQILYILYIEFCRFINYFIRKPYKLFTNSMHLTAYITDSIFLINIFDFKSAFLFLWLFLYVIFFKKFWLFLFCFIRFYRTWHLISLKIAFSSLKKIIIIL